MSHGCCVKDEEIGPGQSRDKQTLVKLEQQQRKGGWRPVQNGHSGGRGQVRKALGRHCCLSWMGRVKREDVSESCRVCGGKEWMNGAARYLEKA